MKEASLFVRKRGELAKLRGEGRGGTATFVRC